MKMAQWIDDRAKNEEDRAKKSQELAEKRALANEPAQREKQQLVIDWDATSEPRREQREIERAERQIRLLQEQLPAMQEEFDRLCAALRAKEKQLATDQQQLDETQQYLEQEAPNSEMYKGIKGIKSLLEQRRQVSKNIDDFTRELKRDEESKPQAEADVKQAHEAQEQQTQQVKQLEADYEKMDVEGINREKSTLSEATLALTRLKAANDAVAAATDTLSGYTTDCENAKHESEKWQIIVVEKRARKEDLSKAVERETDWSKLLQQAHKSLHKGDTCPVCGKKIEELQPTKGENELEELRAQLRQADNDLQEAEARILAANKNIEQSTKRIDNAKKELDDKTAARDKQWQLTSQRLESCGRKVDQIANNAVADLLIDELGEKANQLSKRQEQASALQRQIKAAREQLDNST